MALGFTDARVSPEIGSKQPDFRLLASAFTPLPMHLPLSLFPLLLSKLREIQR